MPDFRESIIHVLDQIDLSTLLAARVTGIEATQSIQHYRSRQHLTSTAHQGADNAVTLVAHKPLIVRAYVDGPAGAVTGTLRVERRRFGGRRILSYTTLGTYAPWGAPSAPPQGAATYAVTRGSLGRTLNFRVPAADVSGSLRLTVTLSTGASRSIEVEARLVQTLRVRCFVIRYRGRSTSAASPEGAPPPPVIDLAAPTMLDVQTTAARALAMMPVQETASFAVAGTVNWFVPLDDRRTRPGACSANWNSLLAVLGLVRDNDGNRNDVVYYGLLPTGMPVGVPGCGLDGLGAGVANDTGTFVHEIGHGYGFDHTPSGDVGKTDPSYPDYAPHPSASIGEYGLDIRSGTVFSPAVSTDYMSYGPNQWMSLYQHGRLLQHPRLVPTWIPEENPFVDVPVAYDPMHLWWPDPPWTKEDLMDRVGQPLVSVRGFVDAAGTVRVDSVARITASPTLHGPVTAWSVQLVGRDGEVAADGRVARVEPHGGCGCGTAGDRDPDRLPFSFHALVPDVEVGSALRVVDPDGDERWERRPEDEPVTFTELDAAGRDSISLWWALSGEGDVWAQWSADDGSTWRGLAVGLTDGHAEVPFTGLPAGRILVRLLAHDGFHTTASPEVGVEVPPEPPTPAVLYPGEGSRVPSDVPLEAWGSAVDQAGDPVEDERLAWLLDGEHIGRGRTATAQPRPGRHHLALRVEDAEAEHEVTFEVVDTELHREQR